ncbi:MAG: DUF1588 domain-containing protein [Verrucomicrobiota bacterium]
MIARSQVLLATLALALCSSAQAKERFIPGAPVEGDFYEIADTFFETHCYDCHDDLVAEAGLSLLDLGPVDETNAAVWKSVWAQVALGEMPPKKKPTPEILDRLRFSDWIVGELTRELADKGGFKAHLDPDKANFVDHDLLFGELPEAIELIPTASPTRIWRLTPQEHITRLNELINTEPEFDPEKPGLRTHGDFVPTNHGGELKLYFGTDRIISWQGGTVAYATSVKSIPVVLSSARKHGFENYPDFYTVNNAEATQILTKAEDILEYMAYGPLSIANPEQITDDPKTYKMEGDIRGLPTALVYSTEVVRPLTPIYDLLKEKDDRDDEALRAAVDYLFEALTFRPPTPQESDDYLTLLIDSINKVGRERGIVMGLSAIFLDRDALFRPELAETGEADDHGRIQLQDWELGLAVNHALRYIRPDPALRQAIVEGRMRTREDVAREVSRMLADDSIRKPRVLRFFRDYFDHDLGGYICKDSRALADTGVSNRGDAHFRAMFDATASTDRLIELILDRDRDVLRELLTTQQVVVTRGDGTYFGRFHTAEERKEAIEKRKQIEAEERGALEQGIAEAEDELAEIEAKLKDGVADRDERKKLTDREKGLKARKQSLAAKLKRYRNDFNINVTPATFAGPEIYARVSRRSFGAGSMKPERTLSTVPEGERLGILTHPAWLVSHSDAMDNHAIHRGIWVRKRLLGGGIPDVPITVDAMLPDEPDTSLRERMRVTRAEYCWSCHEKMDPLGLPFEMFNHAGVFRAQELGEPVDTSGEIIDSGDPALDGPVEDAIDMIQKLADSERVEQVFVRHAFRFWMGRNETLHDRDVLQEAHRAYRDNGGSMNALILSLLTSDAFLYRRDEQAPTVVSVAPEE